MSVAARWSTEEDRTLRRLYAANRAVREIAAALGRSTDAVTARRRQLDVTPRRRPWTAREDALLRAAAASGAPAAWTAARLGRTPEAVRRRHRTLIGHRPRGQRYDAGQDDAIRRCFADGGDIGALASRLDRSADALRLRAQVLGVHRPHQRRRWTAAEDAVVRDGYAQGWTCARIARALPGRTHGSVAARARKLGIADYGRRWTAEEETLLRRQIGARLSLSEVARTLVRTPEAVCRRARRLGLEPPRGDRALRAGDPWSAREDELLRMYAGLNPARLADLLGRSDLAVVARMRALGLRRGRSPHHAAPGVRGLTPAARSTIRRAGGRLSPTGVAALAGRLDVPAATVRLLARDQSPPPADATAARRAG